MDIITVGIDHSTTSTNALAWAAELAKTRNTDLEVTHSWQMPLIAHAPEAVGSLPTPSFMHERAVELVGKQLAECGLDEIPTRVVEGRPGPDLAASTGPGRLVVVGRIGHGFRSFVSRLVDGLLGSTARHVVHHAEGPVAVVPSQSTWVAEPRVLVGVDGTPASLAALSWAVANCPVDATIEAVRYVMPWAHDALMPVDASYTPAIIAAAEGDLKEHVRNTLADIDHEHASVTTKVDIGAASWALGAASNDADLVVVGHRDRSALAHRLLGSVTDHVVRHSRCPVVIVPEPS